MKQWLNHEFQTSSSKTPEFKKFATQFRNAIKKALPENSELVHFNVGHFYVSGFIRRGENFCYFMSSDVRFFLDSWYNHLLVRTAKHEKDFTGGTNQYTTFKTWNEDFESILNFGWLGR